MSAALILNKKGIIGADECAWCAITQDYEGVILKSCSKCKHVKYCSKECQRNHWFKGGHKDFCFFPEERNPSLFPHIERNVQEDLCLICRSVLTDDTTNIRLSCGQIFHSSCLRSTYELCSSKVCPSCRKPLPYDLIRSISLHEEAETIWLEAMNAFKTRTGHSLECLYSGCHELQKSEVKLFIKGKSLHTQAAILGDTCSERFLGLLYYSGLGDAIRKDLELASYYVRNALVGMDANQICMHALLYIDNDYGIECDFEKAIELFRISANLGDGMAQYTLSALLRKGETAQEIEEGFHFLKMSALQENCDALFDLGMIWYEGLYFERSFDQAVRFFKRAAEKGQSRAMFSLSGCFSRGHGVLKDDELAEFWLSKARDDGEPGTEEDINEWFVKHAPA